MPPRSNEFLQSVFSEVPKTYELVNRVLTLGLDARWRKRAARIAASANSGQWADMCTGTGETAVYLNSLSPDGTSVLGFDFTLPMLQEATAKPTTDGVGFIASNVRELPLPDESLDLITMSFATRNINLNRDIIIETFSEYCRVLKPGSSFINLETSRPESPLIRRFFDLYVKLFVKLIGGRISGSNKAYAYLAKTIPRFYPAEELADIMRSAGFGEVTYRQHLFGAVAIHKAKKL
jgi:demethylmenaquinone methyltransferase/2-methoxy-6-polyprenyl-1,4-benzoquinol methylase